MDTPSPSTATTASLLRAAASLNELEKTVALMAAKVRLDALEQANRELTADLEKYRRLWLLAEDHVRILSGAARDTTGQEAHADLLRLLAAVDGSWDSERTLLVDALRAKWVRS